MKLSKEQTRVLSILGDRKVHGTSTSTYTTISSRSPTVVAGTVATALVRRGLARHTPLTPDSVYAFGVQITNPGRRLLKTIKDDIACKAAPTKVTP